MHSFAPRKWQISLKCQKYWGRGGGGWGGGESEGVKGK